MLKGRQEIPSKKKDTDIQIVEAHNYAVLATEPTVKSAKYHSIANLATIDPHFPIQLWCKFIPQIEITLNILQTMRADTQKSVYEALNGRKFNLNRNPLAPVGSRALSCLPSSVRNTFQAHAIDTWYVGPSMLNYREIYFSNPNTGYCTISGTYNLFPTHPCMPAISKDDHPLMAATDLLEMFKNIVPVSAIEKRNHCKILSSLTNDLTEHQTPRRNRWTPAHMEDVPPSRVDQTSNLRVNTIRTLMVGATPTKFADPTAPEVIHTAPQIH